MTRTKDDSLLSVTYRSHDKENVKEGRANFCRSSKGDGTLCLVDINCCPEGCQWEITGRRQWSRFASLLESRYLFDNVRCVRFNSCVIVNNNCNLSLKRTLPTFKFNIYFLIYLFYKNKGKATGYEISRRYLLFFFVDRESKVPLKICDNNIYSSS